MILNDHGKYLFDSMIELVRVNISQHNNNKGHQGCQG